MKERIRIISDYEIEYESDDARKDAMAALKSKESMMGTGPNGRYRATRISLTITGGTALEIPQQGALSL